MKAAITGASGFIGQNLCRYLLSQGHEVTALTKSGSHELEGESGLTVIQADVTDLASLESAFKGMDWVFNLAALFNHPDKQLSDYQAVNVAGVENVINAATKNGVKKIVHCSTVGVAVGGDMPYSEKAPYCPPEWDKYETTKTEGEKLALRYANEKGAPIAVLRPAQVYGPGDLGKVKFYKMVKKGTIVNPGRTLKHLIHVVDLCRAFEAVAKSDAMLGRAVIIAGQVVTPLTQLIDMVAAELGVPTPKVRIPAMPVTLAATVVETIFNAIDRKPPIFRRSMDFFTKSVFFDTTVMQEELGFEPEIPVETGVKQTADWYREKGLI